MVAGRLSVVKYLLFGFNLIFFLCGAGILGTGIWLRVEKGDYITVTDYEFAAASNLAIAAGVVMVVVTLLGVVGSIKENKILLLLFSFSLLLIFCLEISIGGLVYANNGKIATQIRKDLNETIQEKYGEESGITQAIDKMQEYFKCCGNANDIDWHYSQFFIDKKYVPKSCCKEDKRNKDDCGRDLNNINRRGCYKAVEKFILDHLLIISVIGIAFALIQILGMILSMLLLCGISKDGRYDINTALFRWNC